MLSTVSPRFHSFRYTIHRNDAKPFGDTMLDGLFQPTHLLIILVIALFVFGPKKLPELGQGLGKGIRSFRESMKAATEEPEKTDASASTHSETTTK